MNLEPDTTLMETQRLGNVMIRSEAVYFRVLQTTSRRKSVSQKCYLNHVGLTSQITS